MLGAIIGILISGLIVGGLARFAVPGPDPLPIWKTILLGIAGSFIGGIIAGLLGITATETMTGGEALTALLCSLAGATALLILYRKLVQKRPITGPNAKLR